MSAEPARGRDSAPVRRRDCAPARRRDSARSRELLLEAASDLFSVRGFDRTTMRDVGERAGVDPALIARYYGSKAALYLAALRLRHGDESPADLLDRDRLAQLIARASRRDPGPVFQAAVRPHDDPAVQEAARAELYQRLVVPLRERLEREGVAQTQLRAEVAVAAFVGIALSRSAGTFEQLATANPDELIEIVLELLTSGTGTD